jgi:hypothetical protein
VRRAGRYVERRSDLRELRTRLFAERDAESESKRFKENCQVRTNLVDTTPSTTGDAWCDEVEHKGETLEVKTLDSPARIYGRGC